MFRKKSEKKKLIFFYHSILEKKKTHKITEKKSDQILNIQKISEKYRVFFKSQKF